MYFSLLRPTMAAVVLFIVALTLTTYSQKKKVPCANTISCRQPPKLEVEKNAIGTFAGKAVHAPNITFSENEGSSSVLGVHVPHGEKHIYVNLTTQTLSAYEGEELFMQTPISSGLWGRTPTGDSTIWSKFRSTRMTGGSGADYYDLPNVPHVMFYSNSEVPGSAGYSIHGAYWHNNFGHAMSHGCINMKQTDVATLYEWADGPLDQEKGTLITIYE